ncbi:hypothetical protein [Klebsiella pneumoniae]|uniref:hypothetical protein n=1 Tax=Klebsiella pneumoniae TaxID=573 RepID=UPI001328C995|nr:hypothetical protein [Klebsiella pneumoniae]MBD0019718.1 hypothetical protein [Klebsiella pneumoniae]MDS6613559.1 hypothetical protein [Klebsiella pneumoniae]MXL39654.1 hypothetical protein [Klebsiella pneumoniae]
MTTDITELAQLRAELLAHLRKIALSLVEALEKAQAKNALVAGGIEAAAKLHERIAELESSTVTVKLPPKIERNDADGWFMYNGGRVGGGAAEWYNKALDDVSSVQSAAVTVKLPTELELRCGEVCSECAGKALQMVEDKLTDAGIKVEAE